MHEIYFKVHFVLHVVSNSHAISTDTTEKTNHYTAKLKISNLTPTDRSFTTAHDTKRFKPNNISGQNNALTYEQCSINNRVGDPPVAKLKNNVFKKPSSSVLYNGKLSLQLEELLLYSLPLIQICSDGNFTFAKGSREKFSALTLTKYTCYLK